MSYKEPAPIDISEAKAYIASGTPSQIADALLRASLSDVDPMWVETACLQSLERPELEVRWAAMTALGHLARRYRQLDVHTVLTALDPLRKEPALSGKVDDVLDDIAMYIKS